MKRGPTFRLAVLASALFVACVGSMHIGESGISREIALSDFRKLDTGMTRAEIDKALSAKPFGKFGLDLGSDSALILKYLTDLGSGGQVKVIDLMYLTLLKDTLYYWGLPKKYLMSPDSIKREIGMGIIRKDSVDYKNYHNDSTIRNHQYIPPPTFRKF